MATLAIAAGCGASASKVASSTTTTSSTTTSTTMATTIPTTTAATAAPTTATATDRTTTTKPRGAAIVTVTDADTRVTVHRGDTLRVVLGSTYWMFQPLSNPAVLSPQGSPVAAPTRPCVPGGGCGTVTASYTAIATGISTVLAMRTSCGEALACSPAAAHFALSVTVI